MLDAVLLVAKTLHFTEKDILEMPYTRLIRYFKRYEKLKAKSKP